LQEGVIELLHRLCDIGLKVSLETSGDKFCDSVDPRVKKIIDIKTPDSGEPGKFDERNLQFADANTEFKFVLCSDGDFDWAENFAAQNKLFEKSNVLYSPSFKMLGEKNLAEKILAKKSRARLQLQLHKYIWPESMRGV
jgi:7-carboxy-7-deazaguanine synthase